MSICKVSTSLTQASLLLIGFALLISGCAKPTEETQLRTQDETQNEYVSQTADVETSSHPLVGVWLGQGTLDLSSVAIATEGLSPATQQEVESTARIFLATEMAIEFKENGMMETAVEVINRFGKRESGISIATWEATQTMTPGEYQIASIEEQADGSKVTDYKTCRLSQDGQTLSLLVDFSGVLGQCQPKIVLEKQKRRARIAKEQNGSVDLN